MNTKQKQFWCSFCGSEGEHEVDLWRGPVFTNALPLHITVDIFPILEKEKFYNRKSGMYADEICIYICADCASSISMAYENGESDDVEGCASDKAEPSQQCASTAKQQKPAQQSKKTFLERLYTPESLYALLDQYVVGQSAAKRALSVAIYEHYKRIGDVQKRQAKHSSYQDTCIEKSNVLMLGPTGSGKTFLLEVIAQHLGVPFVIEDTSGITSAGYIGGKAEYCVAKLLQKANGNVSLAEHGIVYFDEVDKVAKSKGDDKDANGYGAQASLLKLVEGTTVQSIFMNEKGETSSLSVDTKHILFIAGGAFVDVLDIARKRSKQSGIGFNTPVCKEGASTHYTSVTNEDLQKFGMIPEFLGRFPLRIMLEELSIHELELVLTKPKNALLRQYEKSAYIEGVTLEFTDGAVHAIAETACKNKLGARGLRSIIDQSLIDLRFRLPGLKKKYPNLVKIRVTEGVICLGNEPEYVYIKKDTKTFQKSVTT